MWTIILPIFRSFNRISVARINLRVPIEQMKVDSFFGMIENWIARRRLTKLKYRLLRFWRRFWGDSIVEIEKPNNFPFGLPVNDTLNSKARIRTIIFHWKKREFIKFRWIFSPTQQSIRLSFIWKYINLIRSMHRHCFFFNISQRSSVYSKKKKERKIESKGIFLNLPPHGS